VGLSISYALQISIFLSYFVWIAAEVESNIVFVERIEKSSNLQQEVQWMTIDVSSDWPSAGVIEFKDFYVRYQDGVVLVL
jgi:ATP-binding cassette, subfamily C (CFTR/MRP), member 1